MEEVQRCYNSCRDAAPSRQTLHGLAIWDGNPWQPVYLLKLYIWEGGEGKSERKGRMHSTTNPPSPPPPPPKESLVVDEFYCHHNSCKPLDLYIQLATPTGLGTLRQHYRCFFVGGA